MVNIGPIMFFVPIGRFSVKGGRNITLNTGERLLIGQPHLYENEFREAITENRKFHTETTIRNIERFSNEGLKAFTDLYEEVFGRIADMMTPRGIIDLILRRVRSGQLLALVLPPATRADCVADPKRLENLSGGLVGASAVNPEIADGDDVTFNDLKGMEDKLIYVLKRAPHFITSAEVKKALKEGLSAAAIISVVVVLVAWAASHFFGVGFAIDAILLAIGFVMIGWAIFGAMKKLLKCLKLVKNAKSLSDLDKAAEMMADAIVALGVETLIGLLTRGAGRMKAKSSGGNSGGAAGGGKPRTQKEVEADNKAKADAAKKKEEAEGARAVPKRTTANRVDEISDSKTTRSGREVNEEMRNDYIERNGSDDGFQPPYDETQPVYEFTTSKDVQFSRVHNESNPRGGWIMPKDEIEGLSPQQIKDKFALPETPTMVQTVDVPKGLRLRAGTTAPVDVWGQGGGVQFQGLDRLSGFGQSNPLGGG